MILNTTTRVYDGADGRYLHAADLAALLHAVTAEAESGGIDNFLLPLVLPKIIALIDHLATAPGESRLTLEGENQ